MKKLYQKSIRGEIEMSKEKTRKIELEAWAFKLKAELDRSLLSAREKEMSRVKAQVDDKIFEMIRTILKNPNFVNPMGRIEYLLLKRRRMYNILEHKK